MNEHFIVSDYIGASYNKNKQLIPYQIVDWFPVYNSLTDQQHEETEHEEKNLCRKQPEKNLAELGFLSGWYRHEVSDNLKQTAVQWSDSGGQRGPQHSPRTTMVVVEMRLHRSSLSAEH